MGMFNIPGIEQYEYEPGYLKLPDSLFTDLDALIRQHIVFQSADLERYLIAQTEFLSTFATAQAEETNELSPEQAHRFLDAYLGRMGKDEVVTGPTMDSYKERFDQQEYLNIVRAFRRVSTESIELEQYTVSLLQELHAILTDKLDVLGGPVSGEECNYRSGHLRDGDVWIGGIYKAPGAPVSPDSVSAILERCRQERSAQGVFAASIALYVLHPFSNGNKRVCRIMEHGMLRSIGLNRNNVYSHIVQTYHTLDRYSKAVQAVMSTKVLNHFVAMQLESLFWAQMTTLMARVEYERKQIVAKAEGLIAGKKHVREILDRLIERSEMRFGEVREGLAVNAKSAADALSYCTAKGLLSKRQVGRQVFYSIDADQSLLQKILNIHRSHSQHLQYVPDRFRLSILPHQI